MFQTIPQESLSIPSTTDIKNESISSDRNPESKSTFQQNNKPSQSTSETEGILSKSEVIPTPFPANTPQAPKAKPWYENPIRINNVIDDEPSIEYMVQVFHSSSIQPQQLNEISSSNPHTSTTKFPQNIEQMYQSELNSSNQASTEGSKINYSCGYPKNKPNSQCYGKELLNHSTWQIDEEEQSLDSMETESHLQASNYQDGAVFRSGEWSNSESKYPFLTLKDILSINRHIRQNNSMLRQSQQFQQHLQQQQIQIQSQQQQSSQQSSSRIIIDLTATHYEVLREVCEDALQWQVRRHLGTRSDHMISWIDGYVQPDDLRRMLPFQKINHIPGSQQLGMKNFLSANLNRMHALFPTNYSFTPRSWGLPSEEFTKFVAERQQSKDELNLKQNSNESTPRQGQDYFIVKPKASSQGKGIFLTNDLTFLLNTSQQKLSKDEYIIQEYIPNPLLIDGLKFDLRLYVLIKCINPLKIFLYQEGLARFATIPYEQPSEKNQSELMMHLTNYALNKKSPLFTKNVSIDEDDIGHKRSFTSVLKHLFDEGHDVKRLLAEINQLIIKTIIASQPHMAHQVRAAQPRNEQAEEMCFEILGFDIMLDSELNPYLIEVNHSPSFSTDSPLDYHIKHSLIYDTLRLVHVTPDARKRYFDMKVHQQIEIRKKSHNQLNSIATNESSQQQSISNLSGVISQQKQIIQEQNNQQPLHSHSSNWEETHKGAYTCIFPSETDPMHYNQFIDAATQIHLNELKQEQQQKQFSQNPSILKTSLIKQTSHINQPATPTIESQTLEYQTESLLPIKQHQTISNDSRIQHRHPLLRPNLAPPASNAVPFQLTSACNKSRKLSLNQPSSAHRKESIDPHSREGRSHQGIQNDRPSSENRNHIISSRINNRSLNQRGSSTTNSQAIESVSVKVTIPNSKTANLNNNNHLQSSPPPSRAQQVPLNYLYEPAKPTVYYQVSVKNDVQNQNESPKKLKKLSLSSVKESPRTAHKSNQQSSKMNNQSIISLNQSTIAVTGAGTSSSLNPTPQPIQSISSRRARARLVPISYAPRIDETHQLIRDSKAYSFNAAEQLKRKGSVPTSDLQHSVSCDSTSESSSKSDTASIDSYQQGTSSVVSNLPRSSRESHSRNSNLSNTSNSSLGSSTNQTISISSRSHQRKQSNEGYLIQRHQQQELVLEKEQRSKSINIQQQSQTQSESQEYSLIALQQPTIQKIKMKSDDFINLPSIKESGITVRRFSNMKKLPSILISTPQNELNCNENQNNRFENQNGVKFDLGTLNLNQIALPMLREVTASILNENNVKANSNCLNPLSAVGDLKG